jgi:hypothetical protein
MIPRIEAGETLLALRRASVCNGVGFESELDRQAVIDELRRKAAGEAPPAPVKADPQDLAAMGIGVSNAGEDLPTIDNLNAWLGNEADHG